MEEYKMNKYLIVIDMQNDFIDGALGTPEAQAIVPKVKEKIERAKENGDNKRGVFAPLLCLCINIPPEEITSERCERRSHRSHP